jgi:putative transposase
MTNHVHLLAAPAEEASLPRTMQSLGRHYVRYINRSCRRTGTLWEGRYRTAPIDSDAYFFDRGRYIELNPVRARMVARPVKWRWSSYGAHAHGAADALVAEHPLYRALGRTAAERQKEYRLRFRPPSDDQFISQIRQATNGGWPVGPDRFKRQIAEVLKCRVNPLAPGRRPAVSPDKRQLPLL